MTPLRQRMLEDLQIRRYSPPRGIHKTEIHMRSWQKEAGPSSELRKWFSHDPARWTAFQHKYFAELEERPAAWEPIVKAAKRGTVTLLYSSHDTELTMQSR